MKSVLVRIQEYSAQASGAEKGVLRFLRENPEEAAGYSIKQLADKTFSSAATIVRLCRKMGFDGYKELQKSLLYESAQGEYAAHGAGDKKGRQPGGTGEQGDL